jgi:ABC-2 type transport system permease protein
MITRIAKKEFTEMRRDGRFLLAAAIVFALLSVALAAGWRHSEELKNERAAAAEISRRQWLELPAMNPH